MHGFNSKKSIKKMKSFKTLGTRKKICKDTHFQTINVDVENIMNMFHVFNTI